MRVLGLLPFEMAALELWIRVERALGVELGRAFAGLPMLHSVAVPGPFGERVALSALLRPELG